MRHIFTVDLSEDFAIMYMGHAQGGRNGTGFQTGAEMARDKNNMAGLVELQVNKVRFANFFSFPFESPSFVRVCFDRVPTTVPRSRPRPFYAVHQVTEFTY